MGKSEQRSKDAAMAAHLKNRGIYHGKHTTTTHAPPSPSMKDVGSAAYRRLRAFIDSVPTPNNKKGN